jgi:tetratricopeptide (TPR) repeat protein
MEQYMSTSAWVKDRSRPIVKWITVAAVVIAVGSIVWMLVSRRARSAGEEMAAAMAIHQAMVANPIPPTLPDGQWAFTTEDEKHRKAYEAFTKAANDYPSYNGDVARYMAATHQLYFEADKAEATLKDLAQKDSEVGAQARMALAERYEAVGKTDDAIAEYQKLKAKPGPIPLALIDVSMASAYEAMGKNKEAADLYFAVANNKELRSTGLGSTAVTRLTVIAPERVDQLPPTDAGSSGLGFPGGGIPIQGR